MTISLRGTIALFNGKLPIFSLSNFLLEVCCYSGFLLDKNFRGGGKDNGPLFFKNRLLFILFFLLFIETFRGQMPFRGEFVSSGPSVAESQLFSSCLVSWPP